VNEFKKVISASRRIDMVGTAPHQLAEILAQKCPPETVHSLVIWTKNPENLFAVQPLHKILQQYDQLFFHYTITGMGGSILEPRVPDPLTALKWLDKIVALAKETRRIRFRFDPIVHLKLPDGSLYTNLPWLERFAPRIQQAGIADISISWMSAYRKVVARLRRAGITINEISSQCWKDETDLINEIADRFNFKIHGCCVPQMPKSKCVDGILLNQLHPLGEKCSTQKARGQRSNCGCTESWDIGWYFKCAHGCRYCYANPIEIN